MPNKDNMMISCFKQAQDAVQLIQLDNATTCGYRDIAGSYIFPVVLTSH